MYNKKRSNYTLEPDTDTGLLLWQASNKWQRDLKKVLDRHNLTHVQFILLASTLRLNGMKDATTQMSIASFAGTDKMMASKVLRTLEVKRLIKRKENEADSRSMKIEITSFGKVTLSRAAVEVNKFDQSFFSSLSKKQKGFTKKLKSLLSKN
jgi:DNA-binding MarR family transcriptional regulator